MNNILFDIEIIISGYPYIQKHAICAMNFVLELILVDQWMDSPEEHNIEITVRLQRR